MADLIEVTPSGAVGKQVFSSTDPTILEGIVLTSTVSAAALVVRDGNASGEVKLTLQQEVGSSRPYPLAEEGRRFDKGMHVKLTGVGALCYLEIK